MATTTTALALPHEDWDQLTAAEAERALCDFEALCGGRGHEALSPALRCARVEAEGPFAANAQALLCWALRMCGAEENAVLYSQDAARQVVMDRFFHFWALYRRCHALHCGEARAAPSEHARELLRRLSYCYEVLSRVDRLQGAVHDLYRLHLNSSDPAVPDVVALSSTHQSLLRLWSQEDEGPRARRRSDKEELILYLLECASRHNYRRAEGHVYQEKFVQWTGRRFSSRSWEPVEFDAARKEGERSCMEAFVQRFCRKENNVEMWARYVNQRGGDVAGYLSGCDEREFPRLKRSRSIFSFANGVYDAGAAPCGVFYPYEIASKHLSGDVVASKFFPLEVNSEWFEAGAWWEVPTPLFQSILDYQNWGVRGADPGVENPGVVSAAAASRVAAEAQDQLDSALSELKRGDAAATPRLFGEIRHICAEMATRLAEVERRALEACESRGSSGSSPEPPPPPEEEALPGAPKKRLPGGQLPVDAQKWVYIFVGRLLHDLGAFDAWQIILFVKGKGGTGKSTIAQIARCFFPPDAVATLSSNAEKKFGLQNFLGKDVFICQELKRNIALEASDFQSMVSAEQISVPVKNQAAQVIRWRAPGLLCGNEAPGWVDSQGSIARRMAIVSFRNAISDKDSDPELPKRIIEGELAALLIKCNWAYLETAERHRGQDIWKILPPYFKEERLGMQRDTDPLMAVLHDYVTYELASKAGVHPEECFMPFEDFEADYKRRHKDLRGNGFADALIEDKYDAPFKEVGVTVWSGTRTYEGQPREHTTWLLGIQPRRRQAIL